MAAVSGVTRATITGNSVDTTVARRHFTHQVVPGVRDVEVAISIKRQGNGLVQLCQAGRSTVSRRTRQAISSKRGDHSRTHLPHHVVTSIRNEQSPRTVDCKPNRVIKGSCSGCVTVSGVAGRTRPSNRADQPTGSQNFSHNVIGGICNEQVAGGICNHAQRVVKFCAGGNGTVAGVAGGSVPRHGDNLASGFDNLTNDVITCVCNEQVAGGIYEYPFGTGKGRGGSGRSVSGVAGRTRPGNRDDDTSGLDQLANHMILRVSQVKVPCAVCGNSFDVRQIGVRSLGTVTPVTEVSITGHGVDECAQAIGLASAPLEVLSVTGICGRNLVRANGKSRIADRRHPIHERDRAAIVDPIHLELNRSGG